MTFPEGRLRAADPALALPAQPDERAEHDLALLLTASDAPAPSVTDAPPRRGSGRRSARLVTAMVAAVVLVTTITVLAIVHPRTVAPADPSRSTCAPGGEAALLCGTFRSAGGTGDLTFLASRPYTLLFTREAGFTMVLQGACDTLDQAVTITGSTVEVGNGGGTSRGCSAQKKHDHAQLAANLYAPDITYRLRGDTLVLHFGYSRSSATFTRTPGS